MDRPVRPPAAPVLSLQDAKARFSEVVTAAMHGRAQHVTRRGKPAVVIVAADEFDRLSRAAGSKSLSFVDHLLAIPGGKPGAVRVDPQPKIRPRDVDF